MPDNLMNRFPTALNSLEAMKMPIQMGSEVLDHWIRSFSLGFDLNENFQKFAVEQSQRWCRLVDANPPKSNHPFPTAPYRVSWNLSNCLPNSFPNRIGRRPTTTAGSFSTCRA